MNQGSGELTQATHAAENRRGADVVRALRCRVADVNARGAGLKACAVAFPESPFQLVGEGDPVFSVAVRNAKGLSAFASFDELSVVEAYIEGALDLEGDMYELLRYRVVLSDSRPVAYLYRTYLQPLLFGQTRQDKKWIKGHYDIDADFFGLWLDAELRSYSHGYFENEEESLEVAMNRKVQYAFDMCGLKAGDRVLDIGGGWGSFARFAGSRGVRVTSLTISKASEEFLSGLIQRESLPCRVLRKHFLEYQPKEHGEGVYDAIVNLGVTEHLPNYRRTLSQYVACVKPGGRVYLDAYSGERHGMPSFISKWIFQGNTSPLNLAAYMREVERTPLEVVEVKLDRNNYRLTCEKWARNLEKARQQIVARWGETLYRRFRIYLWAAASSFERNTLSAHRMTLQKVATHR